MGKENSKPEPKVSDSVNTAGSTAMHALAYGLGGHVGAGLADAGLSLFASGYQQRQQRKLMREQFLMQREMTKGQMVDEREAYLRAGLSPALLAEGGFSPAQVDVPSPAIQNVSGKTPDTTALAQQKVLNNSLLEQKATIANIEEQTKGQKLKNDEQEIINNRLTDEDISADRNIRVYLEDALASLPEKSHTRELIEEKLNDSDYRFTAGSMKGAVDFVDLLRSNSNYSKEARYNSLYAEVYSRMRNSENVVNSLAVMPYYDVRKADAYVREVASVITRNLSEVDLNKSQQDVNKQLVRKMAKELALLQYELESRQLSDSRYLIKHARGADLVTNVTINGIEFGADVIRGLLGGAVAGRVMRGSRMLSSTASESINNLPKVGARRANLSEHLSPRELSKIPISERKRMAQIEFQQFRYENPNMPKDKLVKAHEKIGVKYGIFKNPQNKLRK